MRAFFAPYLRSVMEHRAAEMPGEWDDPDETWQDVHPSLANTTIVAPAIDALRSIAPLAARVADCRLYGGLGLYDEVALALDRPESDVRAAWRQVCAHVPIPRWQNGINISCYDPKATPE